MSGEGRPDLDTDGRGLKVTIVSGLWHTRISDGLLAGARTVLTASGAEVTEVQVAGSFELPVAATRNLVDTRPPPASSTSHRVSSSRQVAATTSAPKSYERRRSSRSATNRA
jgi:hypothetical protein